MVLSKKVVAIAVVAVLLVGGVSGYLIYKSLDNEFNLSNAYFDIGDAESLSICTVKGDANTSSYELIGSSSAVSIRNNASDIHGTFTYIVPPSKAKESLDGLQNKLFKDDGTGVLDKVKVYGNASDLGNGTNERNYKDSIVYLEDCGKFILITYYKHDISEVYNLLNNHGDFWSCDDDFISALIYKETGKAYPLSGLWCGCTYSKYVGTNDIMPSISYIGEYQGEDLFQVNIERLLTQGNHNTGEFHDVRGLCTFKVVDGELTYEKIVTEVNPGINDYREGAPGDKIMGFVFDVYKNDVIHYYDIVDYWVSKYFEVKHYLRFTDGSKIQVDKNILECDGYACTSVVYDNDYFPTSYTMYESDGTLKDVSVNSTDSYRIASERSYLGMLQKEVLEDSTVVYYCDDKFKVNRLELFPDGTYTLSQDIFGKQMFSTNRPSIGMKIYDSKVFFGDDIERGVWRGSFHCEYNTYTGFVIDDGRLLTMEDNKIAVYNLSDGSKTVLTVPQIETLLYIYVDGNGDFTVEGYIGSSIAKAILNDDDTFRVITANIGQSSVKTVEV